VLCNDGTAATAAKYKALLASGWHDEGVTGVFGKCFGAHFNDGSQLVAQVIGTLTCIVFVGTFALLWFKLAKRLTPMRTNVEEELQGLDIPEMGAEAYPDYQLTDKSSPL
jgi:Amt family ammonium transporter